MHRLPDLQENISIRNWRIIHSIDESGNDFLYEELTVVPSGCKRYFYYKGYSIPENATSDLMMSISAKNMTDETPLDVVEFSRNADKIRYAIFLDHTNSGDGPMPLSIQCKRINEWKELVTTGASHDSLKIAHETTDLSIEFLAPRGRKWKTMHRVPVVGEYRIDMSDDNLSRIVWKIPSLSPKKLTYSLFLESS